MVKMTGFWLHALAAGLLTLGLSACQKPESTAEETPAQKGTAEQVGEHLDQAAAEAARHLNKMAEGAGKGLEKAGESLQKEAKEAQENAAKSNEAQGSESQAKDKEEQK